MGCVDCISLSGLSKFDKLWEPAGSSAKLGLGKSRYLLPYKISIRVIHIIDWGIKERAVIAFQNEGEIMEGGREKVEGHDRSVWQARQGSFSTRQHQTSRDCTASRKCRESPY
jgi:hypothetical protein